MQELCAGNLDFQDTVSNQTRTCTSRNIGAHTPEFVVRHFFLPNVNYSLLLLTILIVQMQPLSQTAP